MTPALKAFVIFVALIAVLCAALAIASIFGEDPTETPIEIPSPRPNAQVVEPTMPPTMTEWDRIWNAHFEQWEYKCLKYYRIIKRAANNGDTYTAQFYAAEFYAHYCDEPGIDYWEAMEQ